MIRTVQIPLFIGGVELFLIGAVILVLIFGSKATDIAREAGSKAGTIRKTRKSAQQELDKVRGEFEEEVEPIKEEAEAVEADIESVEADLKSVEADTPDTAADRSEQPRSGDASEAIKSNDTASEGDTDAS